MMVVSPATTLVERLGGVHVAWQRLFGFDVFISYKWSDGSAYAEVLKSQLEEAGLIVFIDRHETPGGVRVRADIRHNLLRSRALVVVASSDAISAPEEITPEIDMFVARHPKRPLLGLQFASELSGLPENHPWHPHFHSVSEQDSVLWHTESEGPDALAGGRVHSDTIDYIAKSRSLLSRRRLSKLIAGAATIAIVLLAALGTATTMQRLEEGQQSLALARGFEALDRSESSILDGLMIAADSLAIRDKYSGRRAAMTFWAQTQRITAANNLYLQSPRAIRSRQDGGYEVIGSGGFSVRIEPDLSVPQRALKFDPAGLTEGVSDWVTAAATGDRSEFVLGMRRGNVVRVDPDTGEASCVVNLQNHEISAAGWLSSPDAANDDWVALGVDCGDCDDQGRLVLRSVTDDTQVAIPLEKPRVLQTVQRLAGRNCLLVTGKDWEDGRRSISLVDIEQSFSGIRIARERSFINEKRFDLPPRQVSLLPRHSGPNGSLLAVIDDSPSGSDCGGDFCRDLAIYALDSRQELARISMPRLSFVSFLSGKDIDRDWLVLGDYQGNSWVWDLNDALSGRNEMFPLLQARPSGQRADELYWRNTGPVAFAAARPGNRVMVVGEEGLLFELALPDSSPRIGKRIDPPYSAEACSRFGAATMRQTTPQRRQKICEAIRDKPVTTVAATREHAWVFLADRSVEVLDAETKIIARGRSPITDRVDLHPLSASDTAQLSEIIDGIVDPGQAQNGVWMIRSDGTLLYLCVVDGGIVSREIAYGHGAAPVIVGDNLVSFAPDPGENEIKIRSLADGRVDFDDSDGPIATVSIHGEPLVGLPLPKTSLVFIAVRWNGGLGFELVDLERRRSLSPPISLSADDAWGPSTRSGGSLFEEPAPALAEARVNFEVGTGAVRLVTPTLQAFEIPMRHDEWQNMLSGIVKWRPEPGAAAALGFERDDYPLRPERPVFVAWDKRCGQDTPAFQIPDFLKRLKAPENGAGTLSGTASASATERLHALFPKTAPGCAMGE